MFVQVCPNWQVAHQAAGYLLNAHQLHCLRFGFCVSSLASCWAGRVLSRNLDTCHSKAWHVACALLEKKASCLCMHADVNRHSKEYRTYAHMRLLPRAKAWSQAQIHPQVCVVCMSIGAHRLTVPLYPSGLSHMPWPSSCTHGGQCLHTVAITLYLFNSHCLHAVAIILHVFWPPSACRDHHPVRVFLPSSACCGHHPTGPSRRHNPAHTPLTTISPPCSLALAAPPLLVQAAKYVQCCPDAAWCPFPGCGRALHLDCSTAAAAAPSSTRDLSGSDWDSPCNTACHEQLGCRAFVGPEEHQPACEAREGMPSQEAMPAGEAAACILEAGERWSAQRALEQRWVYRVRGAGVRCACGTRFCFGCSAPMHEPASCQQVGIDGAWWLEGVGRAIELDQVAINCDQVAGWCGAGHRM